MTTPTTGTRTCKYPGCRRPVEQATGAPGRPAEYCDDPEHTAVRAWRARRSGDTAAAGEPDDLGRPVAMASARAGMLRDDFVKTAEQLTEQLSRGLDELRTLTDPDAAAAQVETVSAEAAEQVAAAEVARNRAEVTARQAKSDLAEANDAAQELDTQLQQAVAARAEADRLRQEALAELAEAGTQIEALSGQLATTAGERDQLHARAESLGRDVAAGQQQLQAETRRADDTAARAERDRTASEKAITQLETRLAASSARSDELERQLTATREQLDGAHAAQARLEAQLAAATQRVEEAIARSERSDAARADADRDRVSAEKAATRLEAQLEQARGRVEELTADRDRLTTNLADAARAGGSSTVAGDPASTPPVRRPRKSSRPTPPPD